MTRPYQYCSKYECDERQELKQVSALESTLETCRFSQSKRRLDPMLAVTKYRRAATSSDATSNSVARSGLVLTTTLDHLLQICSTGRATPHHPFIDDMNIIIDFVSDRLRSCQSDATRLMSGRGKANKTNRVAASWHARVIRILLWLQYLCGLNSHNNTDTAKRMLSHMRSTAYSAYWCQREEEDKEEEEEEQVNTSCNDDNNDDEMLCYDAILRICFIAQLPRSSTTRNTLESSWNGILLEFSKRRRQHQKRTRSLSASSYPLWNLALEIGQNAIREQYFWVWKNKRFGKELPILAKCCISDVFLLWRYRTVQQYNLSFAKNESVADMDRLLGISSSLSSSPSSEKNSCCWSVEYATVFGVPVLSSYDNDGDGDDDGDDDDDDDDVGGGDDDSTWFSSKRRRRPTIKMTLKEVSIPEFDSNTIDGNLLKAIRNCDHRWVCGDLYDDNNKEKTRISIPSYTVRQFLKFGSSTINKESDDLSSSSNDSTIFHDTARTALSKSSLSNALMKIPKTKKTKTKTKNYCRFYAKGTCRYGERCRFDHTNFNNK